jgi:hypothetical protein
LKKPITKKRAGGVTNGVGPEFKPQHRKNKNKQKTTKKPMEQDRILEHWYGPANT